MARWLNLALSLVFLSTPACRGESRPDRQAATVDAASADACLASAPCADVACCAGDTAAPSDGLVKIACTLGSCNDGNPCTKDVCGDAGCVHIPVDLDCDDGLVDTIDDHCQDGVCAGALPDSACKTAAQTGYLKSQIKANLFGNRIAFDGTALAVGRTTGLELWVRKGQVWTPQADLPVPAGVVAQSGQSVALSGDTLVVGAPGAFAGPSGELMSAGAAYVFRRDGEIWSQEAYLTASNAGGHDLFGASVAVSGDRIVVGAPGESSAADGVDGDQADNKSYQAGAAYVFARTGSTWTQQAYLKASKHVTDAQFGIAVAISGARLVVGAHRDFDCPPGGSPAPGLNCARPGAAYVFEFASGSWVEDAVLKASNPMTDIKFGAAVALDGDTVAVGAWGENSGAGSDGTKAGTSAKASGAAYVFARKGGAWQQEAFLKAAHAGAGDGFGASVAVAGQTVVVGAPREASTATGIGGDGSSNGAIESGAAYVFVRQAGAWSAHAYIKASNADPGDRFGASVAVAGQTAVVGAPQESSKSRGLGGDQTSNGGAHTGAVYVFRIGAHCDDANMCTADACDAGECSHTNEAAACEDGNLCTGGDSCADGVCLPGAVTTCDDSNPCTDDACQPGSCLHTVNTLPCDDGKECTFIDVCANGVCGGMKIGCNCLPAAALQQGKLKAPAPMGGFFFGSAVALDGPTLVVGEQNHSSGLSGGGAAYVFDYKSGSWTYSTTLTPAYWQAEAYFGASVAVSGDTIVLGMPGDASNAKGIDGKVTAYNVAWSGAAYVFVRTKDGWIPQAVLKADNAAAGAYFGSPVSISGDTIVVGALMEGSNAKGVNGKGPVDGAPMSGAAYVFERDEGTWTQTAFLKANNASASQYFGTAAVSGDWIMVGEPGEDSNATGVYDKTTFDSGAVHVYHRVAGKWQWHSYLKAPIPIAKSGLGVAVALSGDTALVGASSQPADWKGTALTGAGAAYVFARKGDVWSVQASFAAADPGVNDMFGFSVAISGDRALVGAWQEAGASNQVNGDSANDNAPGAGAAYSYVRSGGKWKLAAYIKSNDTGPSERFGAAVAVSGPMLAIGAPQKDGTSASGNFSINIGAVYTFLSNPGCDDGDACTVDTCASGACTHVASESCEDGANCTMGDYCLDGVCLPGAVTTCDDGNPCTADACGAGACLHDGAAGPCDDGLACTKADACVGGLCQGVPVTCMCLSAPAIPVDVVKAKSPIGASGFAITLAVDGDTLAVADGADAGPTLAKEAVRILVQSAGAWKQQAKIVSPAPKPLVSFGASLALDGHTLVIGAPMDASGATGVGADPNDASAASSGAVYVYVRTGGVWLQQAYLKASNTTAMDFFGASVALSGDTLVVGAVGEDGAATGVDGNALQDGAPESGAAYVFVRKGGNWTQQAYLKAAVTAPGGTFGMSAAVFGDWIIVGAPSIADGVATAATPKGGAAYVFRRNNGVWTPHATWKPANTGVSAWFGYSMGIDGDTVVASAPDDASGAKGVNGSEMDIGAPGSGAVYVFQRKGDVWSQSAYLKASNGMPGDQFGRAVAVFGKRILVGAPWQNGAASGVNGNPNALGVLASGAGYLFDPVGGDWQQSAYLKEASPELGAFFGFSAALSATMGVVADSKGFAVASSAQIENSVVLFALDPGCDDNNPCTADTCAAGNCLHTPVAGPCPAGNCVAGICQP